MEHPRRVLNDPLNGSECKLSPRRISKDIICLAEQDETIKTENDNLIESLSTNVALAVSEKLSEANLTNYSTKSIPDEEILEEPINWTIATADILNLNAKKSPINSQQKRLRRSFSETDISNICLDPDVKLDGDEDEELTVQWDMEEDFYNPDEENGQGEKSIKIQTPIRGVQRAADNRSALKKYKKFCSYSPKVCL